jgi:hypothetical protein
MEDTIQKRPVQSLKECRACLGPHEEEMHAATQAVHEWFHDRVTRYLEPVIELKQAS